MKKKLETNNEFESQLNVLRARQLGLPSHDLFERIQREVSKSHMVLSSRQRQFFSIAAMVMLLLNAWVIFSYNNSSQSEDSALSGVRSTLVLDFNLYE